MFTQCPDCDTAFRVTADVLKQAAGKVRCGGCGNAFNALEFLSEEKPVIEAKPEARNEDRELQAEVATEDVASEGPRAISAAQSAALLKTLDQLAGSEVRIEDTGVEWRVVDEDELTDSDEPAPDPASATSSMKWFLGDEGDADAEPGVMADVFDQPGEVELDAELSAGDGEAVIDEFLEETPTPVDQFLTDTPNDVEAGEIFDSADETASTNTSIDELRFDDNTPLPDDFEFDADTVHPSPAADVDGEAIEEPAAEIEEPAKLHVDLELGEADDWQSLLDEVDVHELEAPDDEAEPPAEADEATSDNPPPDVDTQFAMQAEAMGIDLSGTHRAIEEAQALVAAEATAIEVMEQDLAAAEAAMEASTSDEYETLDADDADTAEQDLLTADVDEDESDLADHDYAEPEVAEIDDESAVAFSADEEELSFAAVDEADSDVPVFAEDGELDVAAGDEEYDIPPLTEEEQTINMQIDQDLMSVAVEDDDGFVSTIVKGSFEEIVEEEKRAERARLQSTFEDAPIVETIIMEGDWVQTELERERLAADAAAAVDVGDLGLQEDARETESVPVRGGRRRIDPPSWGMIAAVVALGVLLVLQVLHQSRDSLATIGVFNSVVGPVYRLLGRPLQPAWNVSGWRFEKRRDVVGERNESLTIFSTLGNKSDEALPYPLISVALTDRFEETIGNRVFEPNEYLDNGADPREFVTAGDTFEAELAVGTLAADATGYKLNVCYHVDGNRLRCAIEDFR